MPCWGFNTILSPCFFLSGRGGMELGGGQPPPPPRPVQGSPWDAATIAATPRRNASPSLSYGAGELSLPASSCRTAHLCLPLLFAALAPALEMAKQALC